jgi:hypothetical protein
MTEHMYTAIKPAKIHVVEYDGVKVTFNYNDYTATVVRCNGSIRITTVYPLDWVADGTSTLDFIARIKKFDLQSRRLCFDLLLPV